MLHDAALHHTEHSRDIGSASLMLVGFTLQVIEGHMYKMYSVSDTNGLSCEGGCRGELLRGRIRISLVRNVHFIGVWTFSERHNGPFRKSFGESADQDLAVESLDYVCPVRPVDGFYWFRATLHGLTAFCDALSTDALHSKRHKAVQ